MSAKGQSSSLTQAAYERLRADVLACRLRPGERLKIVDLCSRLAVSLGAIREALSRLTSDGLIVASPQRGFSVAPISPAEFRDLTMVRLQLEESCLRRAIAVGDVRWEARIVAALHLLSQTTEQVPDHVPNQVPNHVNEAWSMAHADYHAALVAACDSPWLLRLREQLYAQTERYRRASVPLASTARDLKAEHRDLAAAVLARETDRAATLMAQHLNRTLAIVVEAEGLRSAVSEEGDAAAFSSRVAATRPVPRRNEYRTNRTGV